MKPLKTAIDPLQIFLQGDGFYKAFSLLSSEEILKGDAALMAAIASPVIVLSAFNCELFFKCLICIETGQIPQEHHLRNLFDRLAPTTQARIEQLWNEKVVPQRKWMWDRIERELNQKVARDLRSALDGGSRTFEKLRYSYEGNTSDIRFSMSDLPQILGQVILELRPQWGHVQRNCQELTTSHTR